MLWFLGIAAVLAITFIVTNGAQKSEINWTLSGNGNEMLVRSGLRVTVFSRDNIRWAYAAAPNNQDDVDFVGDFESQSEAKRAALYNEFGIGQYVETMQEKREHQNHARYSSGSFREAILQDLAKLRKDLTLAENKVEKIIAESSGVPRVKTLKQNLRKGSNKARSLMLRAIDADMASQEREAHSIFEKFCDLRDALEAFERRF